jgi:hypothetical protein
MSEPSDPSDDRLVPSLVALLFDLSKGSEG